MQIFIKTITGRVLPLNAEPTDLIEEIKREVTNRTRVPSKLQRLIFAGKQMEDEFTLSDYDVKNNSTLHLVMELKGGSTLSLLTFNNFEQQKTVYFSSWAPRWKEVQKGVNFCGKCVNKDCKAYNQWVAVPQGLGNFNIHKVAVTCECPICGKIIEDVSNIILFMAKCTIKGMIEGDTNEKVLEKVHSNPRNCLTFENKDETRVRWRYLQMIVEKL